MEVVKKVEMDLQEGVVRGGKRGLKEQECIQLFAYMEQIKDAIAGWLVRGFTVGPFLKPELPKKAKVNGMIRLLKLMGH